MKFTETNKRRGLFFNRRVVCDNCGKPGMIVVPKLFNFQAYFCSQGCLNQKDLHLPLSTQLVDLLTYDDLGNVKGLA